MSGAALKFHRVIRSFDIPARLLVRSISSGIFFCAFRARAVQLKQKRRECRTNTPGARKARQRRRVFEAPRHIRGLRAKKGKGKTKETRPLTLPWLKTIVSREVCRFASGYYANGEQCVIRREQMWKKISKKKKKKNK